MKVLLVDGSCNAKRVAEAMHGIVAIADHAHDVVGAIRCLGHETPDLIVTAAELGDGDAGDVIALARCCRPLPEVVVIGDASPREPWRRQLDPDRFVARCSLGELTALVRRLAARHAAAGS